jgi:hypothetical protein
MLPLITHTWDDEEKNAIKLLLQNNNNLTMGEKVKLFEHQFSSMIGSKVSSTKTEALVSEVAFEFSCFLLQAKTNKAIAVPIKIVFLILFFIFFV